MSLTSLRTGSWWARPDRFALRILLFRARRNFFRPRQEPGRRLVVNKFETCVVLPQHQSNSGRNTLLLSFWSDAEVRKKRRLLVC